MKISRKLAWGLGLLGLMVTFFGRLAWYRAEDMHIDVEQLHLSGALDEAASAHMLAAVDKLGLATDALTGSIRNGQPAAEHWQRLDESLATLREAQAAAVRAVMKSRETQPADPVEHRENELSAEERRLLGRIGDLVRDLSDSSVRMRAPAVSRDACLAALRHIAEVTRRELAPAVARHQDIIHERVLIEIAEVRESTTGLLQLLLIAGLIMLAACVAFGLAIHRQVAAPLLRFERLARAVSAGERQLRLSPHHRTSDELGTLASAFDDMLDHLNATSVSRTELESLVRQRTRELAEREEQFRDLFDNTTDLIQSLTPEGRFLYVNRAWCEALGYAEADLPKLHVFDVIAPECHGRCETIMRRLLAGEKVDLIELSLVTKGGKLLSVEGHVNARLENGRPILTRGIFRDISARKRSEEIVRRQVEFLESLSQTTVDLLSRPQLSVLLPAMVERVARLMDSPYVEIVLVEGDELVVRGAHGPPVRAIGDRADRQRSVFSWQAVDRREPVIVQDFTIEPQAHELHRRWGFHAAALFPILRGTECLGVIVLLRLRPGHVFSDEDVQKGRLMAQLAALVLHNTSIYEEALRAAEAKAAALIESEKIYRHLVENINQGFYTANARGIFIYCNPAISIVSGRTAEMLHHTSCFRLVAPEDRARVVRQYRCWARDHVTDVSIEFRVERSDGRRIWVEQITHILRDSAGKVLEFRNFLRDVTERKAAEAAQRESEERFHMLFDSSPVPIVLSSVPDGLIIDVNQAALRHFSYTREQAVGHTAVDLGLWVHSADREYFIHQLQTKGVVDGFEALMQVRDGRVLNILHHSQVVMLGGRPHAISTIRDVTAQRQVEAENGRLALLAQETDNSVVLTDADGRVVWVNEGFTRLNGYTLAEIRGRKPGDFLRGPKSDPATRRFIREQLARNARFTVDVRNRHKSGHTYWARLALQPWHDPLGKVQGHFAVATDITDRVLEEQTMQLLSTDGIAGDVDVLHHLARCLPDLLDVETCLIGRPELPASGRYRSHGFSLEGTLQPDFVAPIAGSVAESLLQIPVVPAPAPAWSLPGMPGLVDFVGATLAGADNAPLGFIAVLSRRPIQHRSRVEPVLQRLARRLAAELARSLAEDKFRDLFAFAPDAMIIARVGGGITEVNQRAVTLFGFSREELIGQSADMLIPATHRAALQERLKSYLANPAPRSMGEAKPGLVACDKSGRVFPIDLSLSPLSTGQGIFIVAAIRDITKQIEAEERRRRTEAELRQSQKFESLGTLAGGIAHDFNNILTGMLGAAEIARMEIPPDHPATGWINRISAAGSRAKSLVQQILTFSRKNEGHLIPQRLQPVIVEVVGLLRTTIPSMIRIETRIDPDCPPVLADSTQIHQVIMNLCTNAWHAVSEENGLIEVVFSPARLTPESVRVRADLPPGDYACLSVRDNGHGMTATVQEHLFEPFFTTKPKGRGTGLGLAVVHGIIQGHNGAIFVQSRPGEGTKFEIFLPTIVETGAGPVAALPEVIRAGPHDRIILVEDDPLSLATLAGQLQHIGYRVTTNSDPKAALRHILDHPGDFDLVLSDFAMPGMSGLQLAARIIAAQPHLPVILVSGYVEPQQVKDLLAAGIREILRKPVPLSDLSKAIARQLGPSRHG